MKVKFILHAIEETEEIVDVDIDSPIQSLEQLFGIQDIDMKEFTEGILNEKWEEWVACQVDGKWEKVNSRKEKL